VLDGRGGLGGGAPEGGLIWSAARRRRVRGSVDLEDSGAGGRGS